MKTKEIPTTSYYIAYAFLTLAGLILWLGFSDYFMAASSLALALVLLPSSYKKFAVHSKLEKLMVFAHLAGAVALLVYGSGVFIG